MTKREFSPSRTTQTVLTKGLRPSGDLERPIHAIFHTVGRYLGFRNSIGPNMHQQRLCQFLGSVSTETELLEESSLGSPNRVRSGQRIAGDLACSQSGTVPIASLCSRRELSLRKVAEPPEPFERRSRVVPTRCRWAPCIRGHGLGQGQLPCEFYRPPGHCSDAPRSPAKCMVLTEESGRAAEPYERRSRVVPTRCRWAPCIRGHGLGQGQLPCESYRPPGQCS